MVVVKNLMVRCGADFSALTSATTKAQTSMNKMQKSVTTSTSAMTGSINMLKTAMASLGIVFGAYALISFGKNALKVASDLQEIQNVVDVTFGENNKTIENFSKTAIEKFGLSELAAKKYMSSIGAMGKSVGFANAQNEQMSTTITGLIGDFASFRNLNTDEAYTAMAAIYTGETETLKKYGILITETNLQEYARTQGITKSMSAMTQQEKVMLRYNYILAVTKDAQGDFVRTSDSWANQTRVLSQRWQEFSGIMGNGLIQALTPALKMLNTMMSALIRFAQTFASVTGALFGKQIAVASNTADSATAAEDAETGLAGATTAAGKAAKGALAGFDDLNVLQKDTGGGGAAGITPGAGATALNTGDADTGISKLSEMENKIKSVMTNIKNVMTNSKDFILSALAGIASGFAAFKIVGFLSSLGGLSGVFGIVAGKIAALGGAFMAFITSPAALIALAIGAIIGIFVYLYRTNDEVRAAFDTAWAKITEVVIGTAAIIRQVWDEILWPVFQLLINFIVELWNTHLSGLLANLAIFAAGFVTAAADILNKFVLPFISYFVKKIAPAISGVVNGILTVLGGIITFLTGAFVGDWSKAWEGVKTIFKGIWNGIVSYVEAAMSIIADGINWIIRQLNKIKIDIPSWVPGIGGRSFSINISEISKMQLPRLANGGIVDGPTRALIGEAGKEAVLPLENNTEWMNALVEKIGSTEVNVKFMGNLAALGRVLDPVITKEKKRRGGSLVIGVNG